jgi:hypothetical protein
MLMLFLLLGGRKLAEVGDYVTEKNKLCSLENQKDLPLKRPSLPLITLNVKDVIFF